MLFDAYHLQTMFGLMHPVLPSVMHWLKHVHQKGNHILSTLG